MYLQEAHTNPCVIKQVQEGCQKPSAMWTIWTQYTIQEAILCLKLSLICLPKTSDRLCGVIFVQDLVQFVGVFNTLKCFHLFQINSLKY